MKLEWSHLYLQGRITFRDTISLAGKIALKDLDAKHGGGHLFKDRNRRKRGAGSYGGKNETT